MRRALLLLLFASLAVAEGKDGLSPEQKRDLVGIVGKKEWGGLPAWRQRMIAGKYARYLGASERKRAAIDRSGLKAWLIRPERPYQQLPKPLAEEIRKLPDEVRGMAKRLAIMRLRQVRLDRSLWRVPTVDSRWAIFERLFPEPFDPAVARQAHKELEKSLVNAVVTQVRQRLRLEGQALPADEQKRRTHAFVQQAIQQEQQRVVEQIRRELFRLQGLDAKRIRRYLEARGFHLIERIRFVTPRQRELIRYALRPHECPLLDPGFLGPRPKAPAARREWERDFRVLARLELLDRAGFPPEMVLHLAGTGTPEDFYRAAKALRSPPKVSR